MSRLNFKLLTLLLVTFVTIISADVFTVHVGKDGGNVYDPKTTTGLKCVTPSDGPEGSCTPSQNITEIQAPTNKPDRNVTFTIKEDTPSTIFYFCRVAHHCADGML
ncbi:6043_t:CDS:2, partial [Gigaspora rosea]